MSARRTTPLVCPICDGKLKNAQILPLGSVTADLRWELHAGRCQQHGWFQAELISKPPREIFAVTTPGGVARRVTVGGVPVYSFPTIWDSTDRHTDVDPFDASFWAVDWNRMPERGEIVLSH